MGGPNGQGGAIYVNAGSVTVANATFNNHGTASTLHTAAGQLLVRNSILQGPEPCSGSFVDSGKYNVASVDDPECSFQAEDVADASSFGFKTTDPRQNGGPTERSHSRSHRQPWT